MMAGDTHGGKELVVVMSRPLGETPIQRLKYKVLATNKTATMQRELETMGSELTSANRSTRSTPTG